MTDLSFFDALWRTLVARLAGFLPAVLGAALVLLVGLLVSLLLSRFVARLLRRLGMDDWVRRGELGDTLPAALRRTPAQLISSLVFWLFFLCFAVVALEELGLDLSELPVRSFIAYLPVVLGAVLLVVGGALLATFLGRGTDAALAATGVEHHRRLGGLVRGLVLALTLVLVIDQLGFDVNALTTTFSNLLVVVAAGLVFAFAWGGREVARNVLSGYYIRDRFRPGDRLSVDGHEGTLDSIGSLNSCLTTGDGQVIVPNARLIEQTVARRS